MARARNIKPAFFVNDKLAELPALTRLLFIALWTLADREGRLEDRPNRIRVQALPYDQFDANDALQALHDTGFIQRYSVTGNAYIQILSFTKHQNPHHNESPSEIPLPALVESVCDQGIKHTQSTPADSLLLIPDSLNPVEAAQAQPQKKRGARLPNDWQPSTDLTLWAKIKRPGIDLQTETEKFQNFWIAKTGKDATKLDWDATWRNWILNANSQHRTGQTAIPENRIERSNRRIRETLAELEAQESHGGAMGQDDRDVSTVAIAVR